MIDAQFGHVNVVARDWRRLADFYERLFGCVLVPPERDYSGPDLEAGNLCRFGRGPPRDPPDRRDRERQAESHDAQWQ